MRASGLHAPRPTILIGICALALAVGGEPDPPHLPLANGPFHSPYDVAFSPDGKLLAVSDRTAQAVWLVDMAKGNSLRSVALDGEGTGVAWAEDGGRVWVGEYGAASVAEIDPRSGAVVRRLSVGRYPKGVAVAARRGLLLVSNSGTDSVSLLDLDTGREAKRISVPREPQFIAVTRDESLALIGNLLPAGRATAADHAAVISVIDLSARVLVANVRLPPGSTAVRKIVASPDGRWAYVVHSLGRTKVPTTQLERGWVNTNALSIIDLRARTRYATVLLDHPMEGAADPWGTALSKDGKTLWVTLSGVHEVARIDMESLNRFMGGGLPDDHRLARASDYSPGTESTWLRIKRDPKRRSELVNDLAALYGAGLCERRGIPGNGPRGAALSPDGKRLAVGMFFSGCVHLVDTQSGHVTATIDLGTRKEPDQVRRGQMLFHDATRCFQHWLSCATCHPNEGRVDGLNWDVLNDGIGNPKNLKSLLLAHQTPPMMWRGVRKTFDIATRKGFRFLLRQPEPGEVEAVQAYLRSLTPQQSPRRRPDGTLTPAAERGRALFASEKTRCTRCHTGALLTDLKLHDVGTRGTLDHAAEFDTPSLIEVHRTAPYLHDGSAATLREVLCDRNPKDRHGVTSHLDASQLDDLVAYLLSQ